MRRTVRSVRARSIRPTNRSSLRSVMKKLSVLSFQFLVKKTQSLTACAMEFAVALGRSMLAPHKQQLLFAAFGFCFRAHPVTGSAKRLIKPSASLGL